MRFDIYSTVVNFILNPRLPQGYAHCLLISMQILHNYYKTHSIIASIPSRLALQPLCALDSAQYTQETPSDQHAVVPKHYLKPAAEMSAVCGKFLSADTKP